MLEYKFITIKFREWMWSYFLQFDIVCMLGLLAITLDYTTYAQYIH